MPDLRALLQSGALALASCAGPELIVENDALGIGRGSDQNYSSGVRALLATPREEAPKWAREVADGAFFWRRGRPSEALVFSAGQHIYTPEDEETAELIEDDRPYAGWLYGGIAAYDARWDDDAREADDRQTVLELLIGIIGPHSYAQEVQEEIHEIIGEDPPRGWDNQLEDELTVMLALDAAHRFWRKEGDHFGAEVLTNLGGSVGTPYTMASTGFDIRIGYDLPRDFGVSVNEPALSTTPAVRDASHKPSLYFFTGVRGRGIAWNSFLDGNLVHDSHSVDRIPWVADFKAGLAWQHGRLRLHYTFVYRTDEFEEYTGDGHVFGSVGISVSAK